MQASTRAALAGVSEPFPGLRAFESEEEPIFRGRRQHTEELLRRLAAHRFLAVVGTSGSGKSSLVRAGLRPALDRGYLAGATSSWRIAIMRPGMAPIENLAEALRDADALGAADPEKLRSSSLGLVETVRDAGLSSGESLLLIADQFEEIFRYQRRMLARDGGAEAALFVNLLLTAAARPDAPVYIVLTMRSDFLGDCAQFPGLPEALSESQYLIPRLPREQRRLAIEEPLRLFGASMTPQLVEQLLNESGDEVSDPAAGTRYRGGAPDPLPVLQHALMRTYLGWKSLPRSEGDGRIDLKHYRTAGRMESALDQHAEQVFAKELDDEGRKWTERIFRCLTTTELGRPVRRPTPLGELYQIAGARGEDRTKVDKVLALLQRRENSFLKVQRDGTVDITHESLIWKWRRLSGWVAKEAAAAEVYRDLVKDAKGKATWGEPKLSAALAVRQQDDWNEHWAAQYAEGSFEDVTAFLARSRRAVRNQRWLRWFGAAAAVGLMVLAVVAYYADRQAVQKARELEATAIARDGLAKDLETRKQNETTLADRIANLSASQGATKEERDRIAKEKADLEAELTKSRDDSQKLAAQAKQSTDLLASVKSLQSRLDQAQHDRDDAVQARTAAENRAAQLQAQVNSLTKDLEAARTPAPKQDTPKQVPTETASTSLPKAPQQPPPESTGPTPRTLQGHSGTVASLAWSPDGKILASGSWDNTVRLWDVFGGQTPRTLQASRNNVDTVVWSPDGRMLASGGWDKSIRLWDTGSGQLLRTLQGHRGWVRSLAWSPDGKTLASGSADDTVRLWDPATGRSLRNFKVRNSAYAVAWNKSDRLAAGGGSGLLVWDGISTDLQPLPNASNLFVMSLAWSPDGSQLASGLYEHTVRLWNANGVALGTLKGHTGDVNSVAWSPDGKIVASASQDRTVRLWDAASGQQLRVLRNPKGEVRSVAWSPDGKTLASGGEDNLVYLWPVSDAASK